MLDSPVEIAQDAPVAPPRSIRRDGFRRTAVRHVDGNSLLDELSRQINQELIDMIFSQFSLGHFLAIILWTFFSREL